MIFSCEISALLSTLHTFPSCITKTRSDNATSQFFINLVDNRSLDYRGPGAGAGYCVFGTVVEGMDVVDAMAKVKTIRRPPHADVPSEDIVLIAARVVNPLS